MIEKRQYRRDSAERLAIAALSFLAGRPEELERFLAVTGLEVAGLRTAAASPGFLAGVLEHISSDESLLLAFAADGGFSPAAVAAARQQLAGESGTAEG